MKMKLGILASSVLLITLGLTSDPAHSQNFDYNRGNRNDYRNDRNDSRGNYNYENEVRRIYRDVLGRDADFDGLRTWTRELRNGTSSREVRSRIANSTEATAKINQIYRQILGRDADSRGLKTWRNRLASGATLSELRRDIAQSAGVQNRPSYQPPYQPGGGLVTPPPIQPPRIQR